MLGQSKGSQSVLHYVQSRASLPANIGQIMTDHDAFRANMDKASTSEERTINYLNPRFLEAGRADSSRKALLVQTA